MALVDLGRVVPNVGQKLPLVDLGTSYTADLKADIQAGKFEKTFVGGYLTINGHRYYMAHPDYWYNKGDTKCTTHHMLMFPADTLNSGQLNPADGNNRSTISGGYAGTYARTGSNTTLSTAINTIKNDFGASNILTHRERLTNAVSSYYGSGTGWFDSQVELPTEAMIYGSTQYLPRSYPGTYMSENASIDITQLELLRRLPELIAANEGYWLRDIVIISTTFGGACCACVSTMGNCSYGGTKAVLGIRPVFAIK